MTEDFVDCIQLVEDGGKYKRKVQKMSVGTKSFKPTNRQHTDCGIWTCQGKLPSGSQNGSSVEINANS